MARLPTALANNGNGRSHSRLGEEPHPSHSTASWVCDPEPFCEDSRPRTPPAPACVSPAQVRSYCCYGCDRKSEASGPVEIYIYEQHEQKAALKERARHYVCSGILSVPLMLGLESWKGGAVMLLMPTGV